MEIGSKRPPKIIYFRVFLLLGGLFCIACVLPQYFLTPLGHDQISYLMEARRALGGQVLYGSHLAETNPPVIIWFSAIPMALAHHVHRLEADWFRLLVSALMCGSTVWTVQILRRTRMLQRFEAVLLFTLLLVWAELPPAASDFGQREHLLVLFLLPYVLTVATGASKSLPIAERVAVGLAASVGIWFKPHNILVVLALQLFVCVWERRWRSLMAPEFTAMIGGNLLILGAALWFAPLYFTHTLPLLKDTYWALGTETALSLARDQHVYNAVVVLFVGLWLGLRRRMWNPAAAPALLVCSVSASIAFDIQHIGWAYHRYPHIALMEIAVAYFGADLLDGWIAAADFNPVVYGLALIVCLGICSLGAVRILRRTLRDARRHYPPTALDAVLRQCAPEETVYVFSTGVPAMATTYRHNLTWGSRFAHLWMLPALVQNELGPAGPDAPFKRLSTQRLAEISTIQREESAEDLDYWKPAMVLVQQCTAAKPCQGLEDKNFSILAWFLQGREFASAWSHYQRQFSVDGFDVYGRVLQGGARYSGDAVVATPTNESAQPQ